MVVCAVLGMILVELEHTQLRKELMGVHKSLGLLVLGIALLRVLWCIKEGQLEELRYVSRWESAMTATVHYLLLLATIAMPVSGLMISVGKGYPVDLFGLPLLPAEFRSSIWLADIGYLLHGVGRHILIGCITLHVLGAIKNQFLNRDNTLSRMLGKSVPLD